MLKVFTLRDRKIRGQGHKMPDYELTSGHKPLNDRASEIKAFESAVDFAGQHDGDAL